MHICTKAREYEELIERFGARFDNRKCEIILTLPYANGFKKEVRRKLKVRCKYVHNAYPINSGIVVKLHDIDRSEQQFMKQVLYELQRIVDGKRSATMEPRKPKSRKSKRYINNRGGKQQRQLQRRPAVVGA